MDFATAIYVSDLDIAKDDKIDILTELDQVVCTLSEPTVVVEEEETDEEVSAEVPTVAETEDEE